ncbi:S41 family peptidase [Urbifossiella limnaea]|uniref:Putative CtpA-like serine protease n=1 Tax=Urbifossiella limnaea TaxID=2528023 RepID=A0A517XVR1_9BACT|nr:S41 family peptidase [Urbifossiella limnaea]QDU21601.1 putative CtpA-like serine protease [Urbifossiella limnaea]
MVGPATLAVLLLAPAAPVPAGPLAPAADPAKLAEFGDLVYASALELSTRRNDAELHELTAGAVRGLYEAAGTPVPPELLKAARDAKRHEDRAAVIADTRGRLAAAPGLRGPRAFLAAAHGFRHAFDVHSGLATLRVSDSGALDMDFGLGFDLDGLDGPRVTAYQLERRIAAGQVRPTGLLGPPPRPETIASPASFPWRVRRVVPGSPAHRGGLRPGDVISHLNDAEVTALTADRLFGKLADPPGGGVDPKSGQDRQVTHVLKFRRGGAEKRVGVTTERYVSMNVAGAVLREDDTWDGMLDPLHKIGYVRVGMVEMRSNEGVATIVEDLAKRGCRGLVLDLRWCPGGYVDAGTLIAGSFLPQDTVIARLELLPKVQEREQEYKATKGPHHLAMAMAVLVGPDTIGGGELIAAALQDHKRAVIVGQRTPGKAGTQNQYDLGYGGLAFKATYGTTLRATGKPRHRTATSLPTDDWGVRPSPGLEVPVTPGVAETLRGWAVEHGLRPAGDRTSLPFDEPDRDPVRAAALAHLRKQLAAAPAAQN